MKILKNIHHHGITQCSLALVSLSSIQTVSPRASGLLCLSLFSLMVGFFELGAVWMCVCLECFSFFRLEQAFPQQRFGFRGLESMTDAESHAWCFPLVLLAGSSALSKPPDELWLL